LHVPASTGGLATISKIFKMYTNNTFPHTSESFVGALCMVYHLTNNALLFNYIYSIVSWWLLSNRSTARARWLH